MARNERLRIAFDFDRETHRALKIIAAQESTTVKSLVAKALVIVLATHGAARSEDLMKAANGS